MTRTKLLVLFTRALYIGCILPSYQKITRLVDE